MEKESVQLAQNAIQSTLEFFAWLRTKFGIVWAVVITLFSILPPVGFLVWWNWSEITKRPFVDNVVQAPSHSNSALPTPVNGKVNIAVLNLSNDTPDHQHKHLLLDDLTQLDGVARLSVDRTIAEEPQADAAARKLLKEIGADVILWGSVIRYGSRSAIRVYFVAADTTPSSRTTGKYIPDNVTVSLPPLFSQDIFNIIAVLLKTRFASMYERLAGHYSSPDLQPLIDSIDQLIRTRGTHWHPVELARVENILADALQACGTETGNRQQFHRSIEIYRRTNTILSLKAAPQDWIVTQRNLGIALAELGNLDSDSRHLREATATFRSLLKVLTPAESEFEWAGAQVHLGNALASLGEIERSTAYLKEAIAAFRVALPMYTPEQTPAEWSKATINMAIPLHALGRHERNAEHLREAIRLNQAVLDKLTPDKAGFAWAGAANNLGTTWSDLGDLEKNSQYYELAVLKFEAAAQGQTRAMTPFFWAKTQFNRGVALTRLGTQTLDAKYLRQAVIAFDAALQVRTHQFPVARADTLNSRGVALMRLGMIEANARYLNQAFEAFSSAAEAYKAADRDYEYSGVLRNIAIAQDASRKILLSDNAGQSCSALELDGRPAEHSCAL